MTFLNHTGHCTAHKIGSEQFSFFLFLPLCSFSHRTYAETVFGMTYMYYAVLGTFVTIIVAIIVSYFTVSDEDTFDENLLHPCVIQLRHWYNGTSPVQTEDIEQNAVSNVNEGYEITEANGEIEADSVHSIAVGDRTINPTINLNEIKKSKTQAPIERFKKLSFS